MSDSEKNNNFGQESSDQRKETRRIVDQQRSKVWVEDELPEGDYISLQEMVFYLKEKGTSISAEALRKKITNKDLVGYLVYKGETKKTRWIVPVPKDYDEVLRGGDSNEELKTVSHSINLQEIQSKIKDESDGVDQVTDDENQKITTELTKEDLENHSSQTRTLVHSHDVKWQKKIESIQEFHQNEIKEIRYEYKSESRRKNSIILSLIGLSAIAIGGVLTGVLIYSNSQLEDQRQTAVQEKKDLIEVATKREGDLKQENIQLKTELSDQQNISKEEVTKIRSELQTKLEDTQSKLQAKIDMLNEGRVSDAKTQADLSAQLKILQSKLEQLTKDEQEKVPKIGNIANEVLENPESSEKNHDDPNAPKNISKSSSPEEKNQ